MGIPLLQGRSKDKSYGYVLYKVKKRLSGWKRNCLSLADRVVLSKSFLNAIHVYSIIVAKIAKGVVDQIERHQKAFIWGHDLNERSFHPVGWNVLIKNKSCGGISVRSLEEVNVACLAKMFWRLITENEDLWRDVLKHKYNKCRNFSLDILSNSNVSQIWGDLISIWSRVGDLCH